MKSESFGYKNAWFACRSDSPQAVTSALGIVGTGSCTWEDGIKASYTHEGPPNLGPIFVTSPVDGWVLAVGRALWTLCDSDPPKVLEWCANLSQALGGAEVQYFSTYRVVEAHAWGRAKGGIARRSYILIDGEVHEDFGSQSEEEKALGFNFFDFCPVEAEDDSYADREDLELPGEEHVMRLAASWSVDPSELEGRDLEVESGLLGRISLPEPNYPRKPKPVVPTACSETHAVPDDIAPTVTPISAVKPPERSWWRFW